MLVIEGLENEGLTDNKKGKIWFWQGDAGLRQALASAVTKYKPSGNGGEVEQATVYNILASKFPLKLTASMGSSLAIFRMMDCCAGLL